MEIQRAPLLHFLQENREKLLDANFKLSLTSKQICDINEFEINFKLIRNIFKKILSLKLIPATNSNINKFINIGWFTSLKLLEIHRININTIIGISNVRKELECIICFRNLKSLREIFEWELDRNDGFVWTNLKRAILRYNSLNTLDESLEFVPLLIALDLSHNYIQNACLENCLPNLEFLNLSYNHLANVPVFKGQLCDCLQTLILHNNFIDNLEALIRLVNLVELDLQNNLLVEHSNLAPIIYLEKLNLLNLKGNPLYFHANHRLYTLSYLHQSCKLVPFVLDNVTLSKYEQSVVSSLQDFSVQVEENFEPEYQHSHVYNRDWLNDAVAMHDSGIMTGPRPATPSQNSIGSFSDESESGCRNAVTHCESDIEVISNPSQSSIEILENGVRQSRHNNNLNVISEEYSTKIDLDSCR